MMKRAGLNFSPASTSGCMPCVFGCRGIVDLLCCGAPLRQATRFGQKRTSDLAGCCGFHAMSELSLPKLCLIVGVGGPVLMHTAHSLEIDFVWVAIFVVFHVLLFLNHRHFNKSERDKAAQQICDLKRQLTSLEEEKKNVAKVKQQISNPEVRLTPAAAAQPQQIAEVQSRLQQEQNLLEEEKRRTLPKQQKSILN